MVTAACQRQAMGSKQRKRSTPMASTHIKVSFVSKISTSNLGERKILEKMIK